MNVLYVVQFPFAQHKDLIIFMINTTLRLNLAITFAGTRFYPEIKLKYYSQVIYQYKGCHVTMVVNHCTLCLSIYAFKKSGHYCSP